MVDLSLYALTCGVDDADKLLHWMYNRGGVAVWPSLLFGDDTSWSTPALDKAGQPSGKPDWRASNVPSRVITDPKRIGVVTFTEVKRFRVGLRMGSQGMSLKLTDGANRRLNGALAKAGVGATYRFDYKTQEAVVLLPTAVIPLSDWTGTK